jgi:hypothetical protein
MLLNFQENVEKKRRIREIQADFNQFSAQQKYVEIIIRHLMLN